MASISTDNLSFRSKLFLVEPLLHWSLVYFFNILAIWYLFLLTISCFFILAICIIRETVWIKNYPNIALISSSSLSLPYLTYKIWRVYSTVTLPLNSLSYIKNCTRLNNFLGSRPVSSDMHLLYIVSNSALLTHWSKSSSTS